VTARSLDVSHHSVIAQILSRQVSGDNATTRFFFSFSEFHKIRNLKDCDPVLTAICPKIREDRCGQHRAKRFGAGSRQGQI
jgi:hypothetical protein